MVKCKCGKARPTFNEEGETKAICCVNCKTDTMVDVINKKCKGVNCPSVGNFKYEGYCTWCFSHMFPDNPLTFQIRSNSKEIKVRETFIKANEYKTLKVLNYEP